MSDPIHGSLTILRKRQLCARIGLSPAQVYAMLDFKSSSYDPTFPRQIRLAASAVGWLEHEIQAWLETRVKLSREGKGRYERNVGLPQLGRKKSVGEPSQERFRAVQGAA
jgi:prophage regulatory protein